MTLRFRIACQLFVSGPTAESLELTTSFSHEGFPCTLVVTGDDPLSSADLPKEHRYFRRVESLEIQVFEEPPGDILQAFIEAKAFADLVTLLRSVANRCLRAIRNFGMVPYLHELYGEQPENSEAVLQRWDVEFAHDGKNWEPIVPKPPELGLLEALMGSQPQNRGELEIRSWPEIEEAIQDDLAIPAEREFTTNALEHVRLKNLRLAALEAVIALEIVLTRYVTDYMRIYKGTPQTRIRDFLSPEFGLTSRLAGVLDLTLSPEELKRIDLDKVRAAVRWRNSITHRTGHLPDGLSEESVGDAISAVVGLIYLLAEKAAQIVASPEVQRIASDIYEKHKLSRPSIWIFRNHRVWVEFSLLPVIEGFPAAERLEAAVVDLIRRLMERDSRFKPDQHLYVQFFEFPRKLGARWRRGNLELVKIETSK